MELVNHQKLSMKNSFSFIVCICFLFSCHAQVKQAALPHSKDQNTLLWEISGNGLKQKSYLFGTFHLMCKGDILFSTNLKSAVSGAEKVYMEMDMDDPSVLMGGLLMMNMKGGKKLKDFYSPEQYQKLSSYFNDTLQMPFGMLEGVKPYFLIALLYPKMMPCKTVSGVEEELVRLSKENKKEIKGLETMEFQSAVFDSIPYSTQATELLKTIDSLNAYRNYFDTMVTVYKNQQLDKMETLFQNEDFGMEEYQDILLDKRNENWVGQLSKIMKEQPVFVAVGAGHLVGKKGLINLLKENGYSVVPIENK